MEEGLKHYINIRIIELLKEKRLTVKDLNDALEGIPSSIVKQTLLSSRTFEFEELKIIAKFLGVSFFDLVGEAFMAPRKPESTAVKVPADLLQELYISKNLNRLVFEDHINFYKEFKNTKEFVKEINLSLN